ncbi:hypothetical protein R1flu_006448 [Riccia fluitans]|uniref:Uncharacterized protein n=1 Tax=Riccia fluitans TaxID=41844 RepID=A0ABD1YW08_9MARC
MPLAHSTDSKFLRWWSSLVVPSPLNFLANQATLIANEYFAWGASLRLGIIPPGICIVPKRPRKSSRENPLIGAVVDALGNPALVGMVQSPVCQEL